MSLKPNPDEVDATRFVTREELAAMMDPASGLRWSPWFRILAQVCAWLAACWLS